MTVLPEMQAERIDIRPGKNHLGYRGGGLPFGWKHGGRDVPDHVPGDHGEGKRRVAGEGCGSDGGGEIVAREDRQGFVRRGEVRRSCTDSLCHAPRLFGVKGGYETHSGPVAPSMNGSQRVATSFFGSQGRLDRWIDD